MGNVKRVMVIGATGSVGQVVVPELAARGFEPVAVVRDRGRARQLVPMATAAQADVTDRAALAAALVGADGVVLVHGSDDQPEDVDYGAVPAVLEALAGARPHIVLMTSMAVTHATGSWREIMHWKARGEQVLRASTVPATIIRPGWFDLEPAGYGTAVLEQGDRTPVDSRRGVSRQHIAQAITQSLVHPEARGLTFELFSAFGKGPTDWQGQFRDLEADIPGELDAALDPPGAALSTEPLRVRRDIEYQRAKG